jgi:type IV pilus assembly protein PilV
MALIEALVSILIFSFGILGLIGLEASAIDYSVNAEDRTRASLLANEIASSMWLTGTVNVAAAAWQARVANQAQGGLPNGNVTITIVTPNSADILITWKPVNDKPTDPIRQLTTRVVLSQ